MPLTFISLFAGIGGIDLGLERAGMQCVAQVEIDDYANKVLAKHWPNVPRFRDVRDCGAHNLPVADLICGGFPCQDISYAGRGTGLAGERSGLWYEYARIVRELRPRYVLVENVSALLTRGIDAVLGSMASLGYDAEWHCIPAAAVGAPHRRDRVFIVAYTRSARRRQNTRGTHGYESTDAGWATQHDNQPDCDGEGDRTWGILESLAHTDDSRLAIGEGITGDNGTQFPTAERGSLSPNNVPNPDSAERWEIPKGRHVFNRHDTRRQKASDRLSAFRTTVGWSQWATEPDVGRMAHGIPARVDRLKGLGNAVVPQIAEFVGHAIVEFDTRTQ